MVSTIWPPLLGFSWYWPFWSTRSRNSVVPPFKRPVTHAIHGPRFGNGCEVCLPAITSKAGDSSSRPSSTGIRLLSCNPIPPSQGCWARWFVSVFLITPTTLIKGYSASYQRPHVRCCPLVLRVKIGPLEESYLWEAGNCCDDIELTFYLASIIDLKDIWMV